MMSFIFCGGFKKSILFVKVIKPLFVMFKLLGKYFISFSINKCLTKHAMKHQVLINFHRNLFQNLQLWLLLVFEQEVRISGRKCCELSCHEDETFFKGLCTSSLQDVFETNYIGIYNFFMLDIQYI